MLWRTLGALLLGAVVAVVAANAVIALGSGEDPRPPPAIELTPNADESSAGDEPVGEEPVTPSGDGGEPTVLVPPPVHLDPPTASAPPPPPPLPSPTPTPPVPAPPRDVDDDDDDDVDDLDDDVDDLDDDDD